MTASVDAIKKALGPVVGGDELCVLLGYTTYAGVPTNNLVPTHIGQDCFDTANSNWYRSVGLDAANWKAMTS